MDLDADFEAAAAMLVAQPPPGGDGGDGELGEAFDVAADLLLAVPAVDRRLGMPPRSKATAAYARQCLATRRAQAKAVDLQSRLRQLTERRQSRDRPPEGKLGTIGNMVFHGPERGFPRHYGAAEAI